MIHPAVRTSIQVENQKRVRIRATAWFTQRNSAVIPMAWTITHSAMRGQAMRSFESMYPGQNFRCISAVFLWLSDLRFSRSPPEGSIQRSMSVAENEVRPRLHAKENLPQDGQVVHVVGVNCHLRGAARDNQIF